MTGRVLQQLDEGEAGPSLAPLAGGASCHLRALAGPHALLPRAGCYMWTPAREPGTGREEGGWESSADLPPFFFCRSSPRVNVGRHRQEL